jgi:hypothetical protein
MVASQEEISSMSGCVRRRNLRKDQQYSLFTVETATENHTLEDSYEISLLIAKSGKNRTIGKDLIKTAISTFLKTILEKDDRDVKGMSLSNNAVSKRIDELAKDVETQLVEKLR